MSDNGYPPATQPLPGADHRAVIRAAERQREIELILVQVRAGLDAALAGGVNLAAAGRIAGRRVAISICPGPAES